MSTILKAALTGAVVASTVIGLQTLSTSQTVNTALWALAVTAPWAVPIAGFALPVAAVAGASALVAWIWSRPPA